MKISVITKKEESLMLHLLTDMKILRIIMVYKKEHQHETMLILLHLIRQVIIMFEDIEEEEH